MKRTIKHKPNSKNLIEKQTNNKGVKWKFQVLPFLWNSLLISELMIFCFIYIYEISRIQSVILKPTFEQQLLLKCEKSPFWFHSGPDVAYLTEPLLYGNSNRDILQTLKLLSYHIIWSLSFPFFWIPVLSTALLKVWGHLTLEGFHIFVNSFCYVHRCFSIQKQVNWCTVDPFSLNVDMILI